MTGAGEPQREADREASADLAHRMAADQRPAEAGVEAELVVDLPDRADQARDGARDADLVLDEHLRHRPHLPLDRPLDDRAEKDVRVVVARERGLAVEMDRSPVEALRDDA